MVILGMDVEEMHPVLRTYSEGDRTSLGDAWDQEIALEQGDVRTIDIHFEAQSMFCTFEADLVYAGGALHRIPIPFREMDGVPHYEFSVTGQSDSYGVELEISGIFSGTLVPVAEG